MFTQVRTFPCPNCKEIVNDTMDQCRFCSAPIDPKVAGVAAELQGKVNQACNDGSYVKTAAVTMFVFLGLSLVPFMPFVYWGFLFTFFAVIVMIIRWQMRFSKIQTNDPDYTQAKRSKNIALILWIVALPVGFIIRPLLPLIISALLH